MSKVNCSKCGKEYDVSEESIGKKAKCSDCGEIFVIGEKGGSNYDPETIPNQVEDRATEGQSVISKREENNEEKREEKFEKGEDLELKPHKGSFIFFSSGLFLWIMLVIIFALVGLFVPVVLFVSLLFLIISGVSYILVNIAYKKEKYILTDKKIVYHYGNIFSDNSVDINLDKVTQVKGILGFLQHLLFKTGDILIKTAGASSSKVKLKNINNTMNLYEEIQVRMRKNGFHLKKDKLVQEAKPHWLGVMGEVVGKSVGALFFLLYFFIGFTSDGGKISDISSLGNFGFLIYVPVFIAILVVVLIIVFKYLDLKRRKYDVFTDSVFYTEGFLTKNYSFLPMEKVADTENNQSFWSKIFGLHDVIISSEGASSKVVFKNMTDGEEMMKNIKYLKNNITMSKSQILSGEDKKESLIGFTDTTEEVLDYDKNFTATYKMNGLKTFASSLFFILFGLIVGAIFGFESAFIFIMIAFFSAVGLITQFFFTTFIIDNSTIEKKYGFLTNKHNSFSVDKITGVIVKESLLDMLFKTCSITFWSIGSSSSITFKNIKKTANLEADVMRKVGINREENSKTIPVKFSFMNHIKASIGLYILLFFLSIIIIGISVFLEKMFVFFLIPIVCIIILSYFWGVFYYSQKLYSQKIYENFVYSKSGIFFRKKYFVLQRNIKGIISTKYPLTSAGKLKINISGEQVVENQKNKGISIVSNSVSFSYIGEVYAIHDIIDTITRGETLDKEVIKSTHQDIGNNIIGFVFTFGILLLILFVTAPHILIPIVFLVIFASILGLIVWFIKAKYYNLEKDRIVYGSGIIYKSRQTILYKRFNFVSKNQGFLGKIFKNGVVNIYTLGSGSVDMRIKDTEDFREMYEILKKD